MESGAAPGDFAVVLRRLRESRSLTQEELAERSGLTAKAIGALERGERRRPYPHTVRSLADGLALDDDERAALVAAVPSRDAVARPSIDAPLSASARDPGSASSGPPHAGADGAAGRRGAVRTIWPARASRGTKASTRHPRWPALPFPPPRRRRSSGGKPRSTGCVR